MPAKPIQELHRAVENGEIVPDFLILLVHRRRPITGPSDLASTIEIVLNRTKVASAAHCGVLWRNKFRQIADRCIQ